jgi:hypothetical protein
MVIANLLKDEYVEKVECDKPQRDAYEVSNLIEKESKSTLIE